MLNEYFCYHPSFAILPSVYNNQIYAQHLCNGRSESVSLKSFASSSGERIDLFQKIIDRSTVVTNNVSVVYTQIWMKT